MEHQKILSLLIKASNSIFLQENGTLSMISQMQILMWEVKLSITQKYYILSFFITMMITF